MDRNDGGIPKDEADHWLTTGEMARLSQTTLRTVRFYEAEGLIKSGAREDGTHRKFPPGELKKLQIIADLREAGLSLQDIKALAALKAGCPSAEQAATRMSSALCSQLAEMDRRICTLQRVRAELVSMVGMLRACRECPKPDFRLQCDSCETTQQPGVERTTRLFWKN